MKGLFSTLVLTLGLSALLVGCAQPEQTGTAAQADVTYNDPTAVVAAVNDGATYCALHLCYGGTEYWIHLDTGVFTLTESTDLGLTRGVYRQLVGAEVEPDFTIATQYSTYWQAVEDGGMFTLTDP